MIIENPQSKLSRGEVNAPKVDLKQRCADLDLEIQSIKKTLETLKDRREDAQMRERRRKSLDRIYADMKKISDDLIAKQEIINKWPKGILGIKDKKGYINTQLEVSGLISEKLKLESEIKETEDSLKSTELESGTSEEIDQEIKFHQAKVKALAKERRISGVKLFEKPGDTSLEESLEIYGDTFYGPDEVQRVFGIILRPEDIPPLPSRDKLEKAKSLENDNRHIILALKVQEGRPSEWKLFPSRVVPETAFKNYVEETRGIREFLRKNGLGSEEELDEASDETLNEIADLMKTDEVTAFKRLVNMGINQSRRHSLEDMIYFTRLIRGQADDSKFTSVSMRPGFDQQRVLDDSYETTRSYIQDERGVWIQRIGKFTDPRGRGYAKEKNKPASNQTSWKNHYETGVRVII